MNSIPAPESENNFAFVSNVPTPKLVSHREKIIDLLRPLEDTKETEGK